VCSGGKLIPLGMLIAPMDSPCPACETHRFLDLAEIRSSRVASNFACPFCFKNQGLGSLAFKIALDQAMMVNEAMAQEWLSLHFHTHDSDAD
jgi:hypothetical protein